MHMDFLRAINEANTSIMVAVQAMCLHLQFKKVYKSNNNENVYKSYTYIWENANIINMYINKTKQAPVTSVELDTIVMHRIFEVTFGLFPENLDELFSNIDKVSINEAFIVTKWELLAKIIKHSGDDFANPRKIIQLLRLWFATHTCLQLGTMSAVCKVDGSDAAQVKLQKQAYVPAQMQTILKQLLLYIEGPEILRIINQ